MAKVKLIYIYGPESSHSPSFIVKDNHTYKIIHDPGTGSVRYVVDPVNTLIMQELEYDEFGNMMKNTNPDFQPVTYTGGLFDKDTKFLRLGARDYDSTVGRWTTKDPIGFSGGDTNLYAYVGGNPMSYVDPDGKFAVPLFAIPVATATAGYIGSFTGTLIGGGTLSDALNAGTGGAIAGGFAGLTVISGGSTVVAAGITATVDVLFGLTTAIDNVPGPAPVKNVATGLHSLINSNYNNRIDPKVKCDK